MASGAMQAVSNKFKSPTIRIKLDTAYIVYHGFEDTTGPQVLKGCVIISSPDTFKIRQIELEFKGEMKTTHMVRNDERAVSRRLYTQLIP